MRFPAVRMTTFPGVLSEFFSSSSQNRRVSFPSARTCFDKVRGPLPRPPATARAQNVSLVYLDVVIFTAVRGLQAEVAEVESDPVASRDADVPHDVLVVRVRQGEVGGGEAAVQARHVHAVREAEQQEQDKRTSAAGAKEQA